MATNAQAGDGHRNGAIRKRSQLKMRVMGEEHFTRPTSPPVNSTDR